MPRALLTGQKEIEKITGRLVTGERRPTKLEYAEGSTYREEKIRKNDPTSQVVNAKLEYADSPHAGQPNTVPEFGWVVFHRQHTLGNFCFSCS